MTSPKQLTRIDAEVKTCVPFQTGHACRMVQDLVENGFIDRIKVGFEYEANKLTNVIIYVQQNIDDCLDDQIFDEWDGTLENQTPNDWQFMSARITTADELSVTFGDVAVLTTKPVSKADAKKVREAFKNN